MPLDLEDRQALDELKSAVAALTTGAADWRAGSLDDEVIARIAAQVTEAQAAADPGLNRTNGLEQLHGFLPGDVADTIAQLHRRPMNLGTGAARLQKLVELSPKALTARTGIPEEHVVDFQQAADSVFLLEALCQSGRFKQLPKDVRETHYYKDEFAPFAQAMDTATAAEGLEFIPKELSGDLIERINLQLRVAALFGMIQMPTNPFEIPGRAVSRVRLGTKAEEIADTGQAKFLAVTPGSRKITLTAVKLAGRALLSRDAEEDAIIAMLPFIREEMIDYLAADIEDATVNGDDVSPHLDSDVTDYTDPKDPRTAWNGLRFLTQAAQKTDVSNVAPTVLNSIRANRKKMGKYGVGIADLAHLCSISAYLQLLNDTNVYTVDKYGPGATILAGELGRADGTPLIVSEYVRQDLNATGVFDGVTTNRTLIVTVNRRGFLMGERRGTTVEVLRELYAESDQDAVIISRRLAFAARFPTTEGIVAYTYNIAS